jgi:hypothetical protein
MRESQKERERERERGRGVGEIKIGAFNHSFFVHATNHHNKPTVMAI